MELDEYSNCIINIYGGSNIIQPNATQGTLYTSGEQPSAKQGMNVAREVLALDSTPLSIYINKVESLNSYVVKLTACTTSTELAEVVMHMIEAEDRITKDLVVKEKFINLLIPLTPNIKTGKSVSNIRERINDALVRGR